MTFEPSDNPAAWTNRRILTLLALGTLIVSAIWRLPEAMSYISEHSAEIVLTLVLAMALTYLLRPPVRALCRLPMFRSHNGRVWATLLVFIAVGLLIYVLTVIGLRPATGGARALYEQFTAQTPQERQVQITQWQSAIQKAVEPFAWAFPNGGRDLQQDLPKYLNADIAWRYLEPRLGGYIKKAGFIVELLLLPVLVFYFLADGPAIRSECKLLMPAAWRPRGRRMADHLDGVLDGYIRGQVIMCLIAWVFVTLLLWALRVPHAFTLGLFAGFTRAVPVVGPLLGGIPIVLVCLLTTRSLPLTLGVLGAFTLMHFLESKVLLPRIIGHEVDMHPVSVIVALLIGMEFFGFLGVFLAVPIAAVGKILLAEWHETQLAKLSEAAALPASEMTNLETSTSLNGHSPPSRDSGHDLERESSVVVTRATGDRVE